MLISGKQIKDNSVDFKKIETGEGITLDLNGSKITNVGAPTASSDVATKEYVDALGKSSSYCSAADEVYTGNIRAYQNWQAGKRVLCINAGSPGLYESPDGVTYAKSEDWNEISSTIPNTTLIPIRIEKAVYIAHLEKLPNTSSITVSFTKLPQDVYEYLFQNGFITETDIEHGIKRVYLDFSVVANKTDVTNLENSIALKQDKLAQRNAGDGIKISNQKISVNSDSEAIYYEDGKMKLEYASVEQDGILSKEAYEMFMNNIYSTQSNWEENDSSSNAYVQNRTHYVQRTEINHSSDSYVSTGYFEWPLVPSVGDSFVVEIDEETKFNAVAVESENKILIDFGGIEFWYDSTRGNAYGLTGSYSISDSSIFPHVLYKEDVVTLDPKYLPEIILTEKAPSSHDLQKEFFLSIAGKQAGATIQIPKDKVIEDAGSGVTTAEDIAEGGKFGPGTEYEGKFNVGDIYLWFEIYIGGSPSDKIIYINVNKLVDIYVGDGETILIEPVESGSSMKISVIAEGVQSDWEEDDTTSIHHVLNRPAIRKGTGNNSIVEGAITSNNSNGPYSHTEGKSSNMQISLNRVNDTTYTMSGDRRKFGAFTYNDRTYRITNFSYSNNTTTFTIYPGIQDEDVSITAIANRGAFGSCSHSEGSDTTAFGINAHAEGWNTSAIGDYSHAEGQQTLASGSCAHVEGYENVSSGFNAHAEGQRTLASGSRSHAEGFSTTAIGNCSHAEGEDTISSGSASHAEGKGTIASGQSQHTFGEYNIEDDIDEWVSGNSYVIGDKVKKSNGYSYISYICKEDNSDIEFDESHWKIFYTKFNYVEIVGNGSGPANRSNARTLDWDGNEWIAGNLTVAGTTLTVNGQEIEPQVQADWEEGDATSLAHVLNRPAIRKGAASNSTLENDSIDRNTVPSFSITWNNNKFRDSSTLPMNVDLYTNSDGTGTAYKVTKIDYDPSNAMYRFIFTFNTNPPTSTRRLYFVQKNGEASHAENRADALGKYSHAEGAGRAKGDNAHAEGNSVADGVYSHAEGNGAYALGYSSHAEGTSSKAVAANTHAEGYFTEAIGSASHSEGNCTTATHASQHVFGEYNAYDPSSAAATARGTYVEIVGNGTGSSARSNARTLDWNGNEFLAGNLTVNGTTLTVNGQQIEPQVQADWNQTTTTAKDYIKNKPILATVATSGDYSDLSNTPTKTSDFTNDGSDGTSTYVEADDLATVATTGSYNDLEDTPNLATVATTGAYSDLSGTPTNLSDFNNDEGFIDNTVNNLTNYYDKSSVDQMISAISSLKIQVVEELPTEDIDTSTIYLVPIAGSPSEDNYYEEYIYIVVEEGSPIVGHWEMIGTAQVDLTDYMQKSNNLSDVADRQTALNNLTGSGVAQAGKFLKVDNNGNIAFGNVDPQIQADWEQSDSTAADYIKNKPYIERGIANNSIKSSGANSASGANSISVGYDTTASSASAAAFGRSTTASGWCSFAAGSLSEASGQGAASIGMSTVAAGNYSTAVGHSSEARGTSSFASGEGTYARGDYSTSFGNSTAANGQASLAEGSNTIASHKSQHVFGEYNESDPSSAAATARGTYVEIVGNGTSSTRSNARTLDWNGNEVLSGTSTATDFIIPGTPSISLSGVASSMPTHTSDLINDGEAGSPDSRFVEEYELASVATSGDYTDLSNTPDLTIYAESNDLADIAFSGNYTDLGGATGADVDKVLAVSSTGVFNLINRFDTASGMTANEISIHDHRTAVMTNFKEYIPLMKFKHRNSANKFQIEFSVMSVDGEYGKPSYYARYIFFRASAFNPEGRFYCVDFASSDNTVFYFDDVLAVDTTIDGDDYTIFYKKKIQNSQDYNVYMIHSMSTYTYDGSKGYVVPTYYVGDFPGQSTFVLKDGEVQLTAADTKYYSELENSLFPCEDKTSTMNVEPLSTNDINNILV